VSDERRAIAAIILGLLLSIGTRADAAERAGTIT
jgi:hypothetical protein